MFLLAFAWIIFRLLEQCQDWGSAIYLEEVFLYHWSILSIPSIEANFLLLRFIFSAEGLQSS